MGIVGTVIVVVLIALVIIFIAINRDQVGKEEVILSVIAVAVSFDWRFAVDEQPGR